MNLKDLPLKQSELDFQRAVIDLAHYTGWTVAHFRGAWSKDGQRFITPVQGDGSGFPDLILVRPPRIIFMELKSARGKFSSEQEKWRSLLVQCPGIEYVWVRPDDWPMIEKLLKKQ